MIHLTDDVVETRIIETPAKSLNPLENAFSSISGALAFLDEKKADKAEVLELAQENRKLKAQCAKLHQSMQSLNHQRDYLSVQALMSALYIKWDSEKKKSIGRELTKLSKELGIPKDWREDDRFEKGLGVYHPFVCHEFCEKNEFPIPPVLHLVVDPR
jgi:hypothetical protein